MSDLAKPTRRQFLKVGVATLAAIPVMGVGTSAFAAKNDAVRTALSYQASPKDGKSCATCVNFKPAEEGCNLFPGDTEIVATGYCTAFVAKP